MSHAWSKQKVAAIAPTSRRKWPMRSILKKRWRRSRYMDFLICVMLSRMKQLYKVCPINSGGLKVGGPRQGWKRGPLKTPSYAVNRDTTFWSSLGRRYALHPRIRSWDYTVDWHIGKCKKSINDAQLQKHWKLGTQS